MKILLVALALAMFVGGCTNLPSAGWYERNGTQERAYALFTGEEPAVAAKFPGAFQKQDFISAMAKSPSAQYLSAGRPRYYTVLATAPDKTTDLRLVTLEILERDYVRK
jgi:PBP1b-binding outer membrane lipoprotein LpoB